MWRVAQKGEHYIIMKKKKNRECVHCINFKTLFIDKYNIKLIPIANEYKIHKKINKEGITRIYFCKFDRLDRHVYVHTPMIYKLIKKECPYYNVLPSELEKSKGMGAVAYDVLRKIKSDL